MGDALAVSLRIIQAELDRSLQPQSPAVAASLQTIEHVKDVLITKKAHFDLKYADDLMGVASRQLLGPTDKNNQSMSAIPSASSLNSIKNPSPSLPSSSSLTEVKTSFKYPTAPPRTPSAQAQLEPWQDNAPKIGMPLAPAPTHMHHYQGGHGKTPDDTVPDLGDWQTTSTPIAHPLSGGNAMPRLPPTSRVTHTDHKYRQDPSHVIGYSESSAGRHRRTQSRGVEAADPLGALF